MKDINTMNGIVSLEEENDFLCRELKNLDVMLNIDEETSQALNEKFNLELTELVRQRIKHITTEVYEDYLNNILNKQHENFADFIDDVIKYQNANITKLQNTYKDTLKEIASIKEGSSNPWDFDVQFYLNISKVINVSMKIITKKINEHKPAIKTAAINSVSGLCARSDKDMSSKQLKNAMGDAMTKLLVSKQEKQKKIFLEKLQKYSLKSVY
jgi:hypothetical protein